MTRRLGIETSEGTFIATFSERGLAALRFPCGQTSIDEEAESHLQWKQQTIDAVHSVLRGEQPKELPPFDLSGGTAFQQRVWGALLAIPAGATRSYSEVARAIGAPGAARAVGAACGANPVPVLIPCHRVLAANQAIGGFSAGLHWKRLLLEREGIVVSSATHSRQSQDRWRRDGQFTLGELFAQELHE